ncbi:MAG: NAD(P)-dependent alcohol dehydrogenase [Betaproteobacteria bacterium]|jgi:NADPH:quinone reductase-like Zn-dependent oxidoreductase|nr:MAG: NAD(P)-dependent alcohol dehydrogenase [Betaproteobacteria bacterium]
MRAVEATDFSIDALALTERPVPEVRRGEILLKISAASLNYRDFAILAQKYMPKLKLPYVPASDCCGEVIEIGEGVTRFKEGDRVIPVYTQGWHDGKPTPQQRTGRTLGAPLSGVLQEYIAVPEEDAVHPPTNLSDVEAATLPIAALTAWSALQEGGVKSGDVVLVQGTGGVALFAMQFAKLAGASVIVVSSSDEKLARVKRMGADVGINYRAHPEWDVAVKEATGGRGVDIVVETAGSTLPKSLAAVTFGGFIGVIGFVGGGQAEISVRSVIGPMIRVQGIAVGSRTRFEAMNRAIAAHQLKPAVDSTFDLDHVADAFRRLEHGQHFGKIGIKI